MSPPIRFGTDGWRALVAEEFTFPNVRAVTQAVAEYLRVHPDRSRASTVLVGYDTRPLGDRFAESVAEVFAGNGFQVLLTRTPMPTPAISFAIRELKTQGGIVVTASHNPFTYNGIKFKPSYAGPAEPEMTRWVESRLFRGTLRRVPLQEGIRTGKIRRIDLGPRYLRFLRSYVRWPVIRRAKFRVAYESMMGAGQDLLQQVLEGSSIEVVPVPREVGAIRSSHRPEPVGDHLGELSETVRTFKCDVGLATDGDADRLGLMDSSGRFVSSQETMALLIWHLLEDRRRRGMVVSTVSGTNLLESITGHYKVPLQRTPVGFKHIARFMRTENVLLGGEESGGFGFQGCVPERDGLLAGLLILEMMAMRKKSLSDILRQMRSRFGHWIFRRADLELDRSLSAGQLLRWAQSAEAKRLSWPSAGAVREVITMDGVKLVFQDSSWMLLRPSGTEPLLRIYAEGRTSKIVEGLLKAGQSVGRRITHGPIPNSESVHHRAY